MAGEAGASDVLEATLTDPKGTSFPVLSGTIPRTMGTTHDTATLVVLASSRLKKALEFDESFTLIAPGNFNRMVLPIPGSGTELRTVSWTLKVNPVGEPSFEVTPLILVEASVQQHSVADSSLGPLTADSGGDRPESWTLSLADSRILWPETGHLAGRRNFRDAKHSLRQFAVVPPQNIEIAVGRVNVNGDGVLSLSSGEPVSFTPQQVSASFDPTSLNSDATVSTASELFFEIAERLPLLTAGGGPPEVLTQLEKLVPLDIDYGVGSSAQQAMDILSKKVGVVVGIDLDGSLIVEFEGAPTLTRLQASGVVGRSGRFISESRATKIRPRSSLFRFYPNKVIQQIATGDFEPAIKGSGGSLFSAASVAGQGGASINHLAYLAAVKGVHEQPPNKDSLEKALQGTTVSGAPSGERPPTPAVGEIVSSAALILGIQGSPEAGSDSKTDVIRALADQAFSSFRYVGSKGPLIKQQAQQARSTARAELKARTLAAAAEYGEGGKSIGSASVTVVNFSALAMLDSLLAPPWKMVTRADFVGDLAPAFFSDVILHRAYDFMNTANLITVQSFESDQENFEDPEIIPIDIGFRQEGLDNAIKASKFFGEGVSAFTKPPQK